MAAIDPLPPSLIESLARFPSTGERNIWLFTVASRARHVASPAKVQRFLHRIVSTAGWSDRDFTREIDRAVQRAYSGETSRAGEVSRIPRNKPSVRLVWPDFEESLWKKYSTRSAIFPVDLDHVTQSQDWMPSGEAILDQLFDSEDLLCLGLDFRSAITQPRTQWRRLEASMEFIVANPMTATTGLTKDQRTSYRCHGNATQSRRFQVIEFDRGTPEEQAAILSALHSERTPLILAVWSGGKSIHGWFDVRRLDESQKIRFFAAACRLGADSTLWDPCKLVRMPGGRRSNGKSQPILYFNPDAC